MIKLVRLARPAELTPQVEKQLVNKFKASMHQKKVARVWDKAYIKRSLAEMSANKCAYSEVRLGEEGKYLEVEHFKCKKCYPDLVVRWDNLLPASKVCNVKKGELNVVKTPILDPMVDEPKEHLYVEVGRFYHKTDKGENSIRSLDLNNREQFVEPRYKECQILDESFEDWVVALRGGEDYPYCVGRIKKVLMRCDERSAYSAVIATYILYESEAYSRLKKILQERGYWDSDFDQIEAMLDRLALPKP